MSEVSQNDVVSQLKIRRVLWPVLIGLTVAGGLMYREFDPKAFQQISWTWHVAAWILVGFCAMAVRDLFFILRMRLMTDRQLSWRSAIQVSLLWEFSSAATPSILGGAPVAAFLLIKEKIAAGQSAAIIFFIIFMDELFFTLAVLFGFLTVGYEPIFQTFGGFGAEGSLLGQGLMATFITAYSIISVYTSFLVFGLFISPKTINRWLKKIFMAKWLKRWRSGGFQVAEDLLHASRTFANKPLFFWVKVVCLSLLGWSARYLVLNCLVVAFSNSPIGFFDHLMIYGREAAMFVMMIVSPTPGSSGVAEFLFLELLSDLSPTNFGAAMAFIWRLITYYPYLLIGIFLLPRWIRRVYANAKEPKQEAPTAVVEKQKVPNEG